MPSFKVVSLSNDWEVLVRPVPPTASYRWQKANIDFPKRPGRPMATYKSELDGHEETVPALPESKEWVRWEAGMIAWQLECNLLREDNVQKESDFSLEYAIYAWRLKESDSDWIENPPEDWVVPDVMEKYGADPFTDRRLAFIHLELLEYQTDFDKVHAVAFPSGEEDTSPVTDEEVGAALRSFRPGDGSARGDLGRGSRGTKNRDKVLGTGTGAIGAGQSRSIVGRLVQMFSRR